MLTKKVEEKAKKKNSDRYDDDDGEDHKEIHNLSSSI